MVRYKISTGFRAKTKNIYIFFYKFQTVRDPFAVKSDRCGAHRAAGTDWMAPETDTVQCRARDCGYPDDDRYDDRYDPFSA